MEQLLSGRDDYEPTALLTMEAGWGSYVIATP